MPAILVEALENWKVLLGAAAVGILIGVCVLFHHELTDARAATATATKSLDAANQTIGTQKAQLVTLQADNSNLATKLNEQSDAVQDLADRSQAADKAAADAMTQAKAKQAASAALIASLQAKIKNNPTESCHDAINDWRNAGEPDVAGL